MFDKDDVARNSFSLQFFACYLEGEHLAELSEQESKKWIFCNEVLDTGTSILKIYRNPA